MAAQWRRVGKPDKGKEAVQSIQVSFFLFVVDSCTTGCFDSLHRSSSDDPWMILQDDFTVHEQIIVISVIPFSTTAHCCV
jgi:hypothetical protein